MIPLGTRVIVGLMNCGCPEMRVFGGIIGGVEQDGNKLQYKINYDNGWYKEDVVFDSIEKFSEFVKKSFSFDIKEG